MVSTLSELFCQRSATTWRCVFSGTVSRIISEPAVPDRQDGRRSSAVSSAQFQAGDFDRVSIVPPVSSQNLIQTDRHVINVLC
jgi:hypothetical protein